MNCCAVALCVCLNCERTRERPVCRVQIYPTELLNPLTKNGAAASVPRLELAALCGFRLTILFGCSPSLCYLPSQNIFRGQHKSPTSTSTSTHTFTGYPSRRTCSTMSSTATSSDHPLQSRFIGMFSYGSNNEQQLRARVNSPRLRCEATVHHMLRLPHLQRVHLELPPLQSRGSCLDKTTRRL